jgi:hypothetical protein
MIPVLTTAHHRWNQKNPGAVKIEIWWRRNFHKKWSDTQKSVLGVGWGGHCLVYCTSPGWWMMMISVGQSVEWVAGETEVLGENLPQYHFVHHKSHMTWHNPGSSPGQKSSYISIIIMDHRHWSHLPTFPTQAFPSSASQLRGIFLACSSRHLPF